MLKSIVHEWMLLAVVPCTKASLIRESDRAQAVFVEPEGSYCTAEPGSRCQAAAVPCVAQRLLLLFFDALLLL